MGKNVMGSDSSYASGAYNQTANVALEMVPEDCVCTPGNCMCGPECDCMCCWGNTRAGRTTNIQGDEKSVLDNGVLRLVAKTRGADLGSDHDSYAQGAYRHNTPFGLED